MKPKVRSFIEELDNLVTSRDKEQLVESRATHIISSAINLINYIKENYDAEMSLDLERRLINSIKSQDLNKFSRGIRRLRENKNNEN